MNLNKFLREQTSQRKLRLFSVACCNEILYLMKDQRSINGIKVAELYADGLATKEELNAAYAAANAAANAAAYAASFAAAYTLYAAYAAADAAADAASFAAAYTLYAAFAAADAAVHAAAANAAAACTAASAAARKKQEQIAEDIFHSSNAIIPTSRAVLAIAQSIYQNKCWSDMPILADALEDTGCIDNQILAHLRSNQSHYRGCWALDLILGKD